MRIHIQNPPGESLFPVTRAQWDAALARCPALGAPDVSFADDDAGFAAAIGEAEVLLTWTKVVRARFVDGGAAAMAPRLKVIACTSAGLDRLAPFDWLPEGVLLLNNRGTHSAKAGEFALMALLMLATHMPRFATAQRAERWAPRFASLLAGRTVCVVGLGSLGGAAARQARAFGMQVIGIRSSATPHPDCDEVHATEALDQVLPRAEFLLLACPLTPATRGLLDRRRIGLLPPGAKLVNMARGAVWDQDAVCDALQAGALDGAVTDVAVPEPLPPGHRLWSTPGLVVVPHVSSDDPATYNDRTLDILFHNLLELRAGRPAPNRVEPSRGY
ncbi:D-2-hydroxyacid dehydrogenase [Falsiroseomonas selenitidurans]|uniref:D-2-hydroxyacid dehydrogenase n=1 Tax=Falsiroseomonas selenitidurans TaxID=2716335 RepID=A0ABX1DZD3_9PROT|nr:D-2-hydroxyacid dehydrogenase [Falsiroseomonas selenitidurans]NKC30236.1 D-2-hydroxyacid dehydrogenase [Falsiroseomonas selenitidurans]